MLLNDAEICCIYKYKVYFRKINAYETFVEWKNKYTRSTRTKTSSYGILSTKNIKGMTWDPALPWTELNTSEYWKLIWIATVCNFPGLTKLRRNSSTSIFRVHSDDGDNVFLRSFGINLQYYTTPQHTRLKQG